MTPLLLAAVLVTATPDAAKPEPCPLFWDEVEYGAGRHNKAIHEFPPDQRAVLVDNWNHYDPPTHDVFAHIYAIGRMLFWVDVDNCVQVHAIPAEGELERMLAPRPGSGL